MDMRSSRAWYSTTPSVLAASMLRWCSARDEAYHQVAAQQRTAERVEAHHVAVVADDSRRLEVACPPCDGGHLGHQARGDDHRVERPEAIADHHQHRQATREQARQRKGEAAVRSPRHGSGAIAAGTVLLDLVQLRE